MSQTAHVYPFLFYFYMTTKNSLTETICSAMERLQIEQLTPMQRDMLAQFGKQQNMTLLAPTGSGKTLAFLLPLLEQVQKQPQRLQTIIIAPSRELAIQIDSVWKSMKSPAQSVCCYGGHAIATEKKDIARVQPALIIGTPGRLLDHLDKGNINAKGVISLVIDEFDKSLELGFQEQMESIMAYLPSLKQTILCSATDIDELPEFASIEEPIRVDYLDGGLVQSAVDDAEEPASRLQMYRVVSPAKDKIECLYNLLCTLGNESTMLFCNHRASVDRVYSLLKEKGILAVRYHGGMEQMDRERSLYTFRTGSRHLLVATDLAARGLDIPEVQHVIHYHMPIDQEAYTHRNGRTARWTSTGSAYVLLHGEEKMPAYLQELLDEMPILELPAQPTSIPKPEWATVYIGKGKKHKLSKMDVVGFLCKKGRLSAQDLGLIVVQPTCCYVAVRRRKLKSLLQLVHNEKIKGLNTKIEEAYG